LNDKSVKSLGFSPQNLNFEFCTKNQPIFLFLRFSSKSVTAGFWSSFDIVNPDSHIFFHRTFFISFFIYFFNTCVQLLLASQCTATRIRHMISTAFARSTQKAGVLIYHSHCFKKKISIASSATVLWHAIEHRDVSTKVKRPAVARPLKLARVGSNIIWI
jgi:hypothetical protein